MKGYWIATYSEIKDPERMKKYADKAKEAVLKHSGKIFVGKCPSSFLQQTRCTGGRGLAREVYGVWVCWPYKGDHQCTYLRKVCYSEKLFKIFTLP